MKIVKTTLIALTVIVALAVPQITSASTITTVGGWEIEANETYAATGFAWFDVDNATSEQIFTGIATIGSIKGNATDLVWDAATPGASTLVIVFDGSAVSFWELDGTGSTFTATGGFASDSDNIKSNTNNELLFEASANTVSTAGGTNSDSFSLNFGLLSVTNNGLIGGYFNSNTFNGSDFEFLLNGSRAANGEYAFSGVSTLKGTTVATVPVPGAVWLLGTGLIGMIGAHRKNTA